MANNSGNNILAVLCKLESEIAYVRKRLVVRNASHSVRHHLSNAAAEAEKAVSCAEADIEYALKQE